MENNILSICEGIRRLALQQELIFEHTDLEILHVVADELLSEMGEIEQRDNVRKALMNMFIAGTILPNFKTEKL